MPKRALYSLDLMIRLKDAVREQRLSPCAQYIMPRVYLTRGIPKLTHTLAAVLLAKPEAMSQMSFSAMPTKSPNASSPPSSRMLPRLSSMLNLIHSRAWSTGFLSGGGGTATASTFDAMLK